MNHKAIAIPLAIFALVACATSTKTEFIEPNADVKPTDPAKKKPANDAGSDASTSSSSSSSGGASSSGGSSSSSGGTGACGGEASYDACVTCCRSAHQTGSRTYIGALVTCLCKTSNCKTQCNSTLCAASPTSPDVTCDTCASSKASSCSTDVQAACQTDADCMAFVQCMQTSQCDKKP